MKWILFVYLSTFSAHSGMTITTAEFDSQQACTSAAEKVKEEFKSFFIQPIKTLCVAKGQQ
jgi:hypothetical protein